MRSRELRVFTVLLAAMLFVPLAACQSTPRQQFAQVNDTFITTVQVLNVAHDQGHFTDEEWVEDIVPLVKAGNALLDQYDTVTRTGMNGDPILIQVREILTALRPFVSRLDE